LFFICFFPLQLFPSQRRKYRKDVHTLQIVNKNIKTNLRGVAYETKMKLKYKNNNPKRKVQKKTFELR